MDAAARARVKAKLAFVFRNDQKDANNTEEKVGNRAGKSERLKNLFSNVPPHSVPMSICVNKTSSSQQANDNERSNNPPAVDDFDYVHAAAEHGEEINMNDYFCGEDDNDEEEESDCEEEEIDERILYDDVSGENDETCAAPLHSACETSGSFVEESRIRLQQCPTCVGNLNACSEFRADQRPTDIDKAQNAFIVDIKTFCVS